MADLTQLLGAAAAGDPTAAAELLPLVYDELRRLAQNYLSRERQGHTLQTTALVHEAYLRLIDQRSVTWQNRAQFFGIAAQMMRRILINHAKERNAKKRQGYATKVSLDDAVSFFEKRELDLMALDEALNELAALDPQQTQIVELRFFGGLQGVIETYGRTLVQLQDVQAKIELRPQQEGAAVLSFAADLAHELKNPLASIRSATEILADVDTPAERRRFLELVQREVARMEHLLTVSRELARIDAGIETETRQLVDLNGLLAAIAEAYRLREGSHPSIELQLGPAPVRTRGVPERLTAVFENLLDNALSFSPPPGTTRVELGRDGGWAVVTISEFSRGAVEALGIPSGQVTVIRPGAAIPTGLGGGPVSMPEGAKVVLSVGRLVDAYKGHDMVIRAWPLVIGRVPLARYVIIGDGPLVAYLKRHKRRFGLRGTGCVGRRWRLTIPRRRTAAEHKRSGYD